MDYELEPRSEGILTAKVIMLASLLCPYMIDWLNSSEISHIVVYAPVWMFVQSPDYFFASPTPMALLLFFYWTPYVLVAYLSYRYANAQVPGDRKYVGLVAILMTIAVLMTMSLSMSPRASSGGEDLFALVVPIPIASILAVLLIPLLRPRRIVAPWSENKSEDETVFQEAD